MSLIAGGAGVGAGLVSRLIGSGIQRLGSMVFQKALRVAKIDSALRSATQKNPIVQTALRDIEIVIGSRFGGLNDALNEFFRELERGGVINQMVEDALLNRQCQHLRATFLELHAKIVQAANGASEDLFDKMMTSFRVTIQELAKDRVILDVFRLHREELEYRLKKLDQALVTISNDLRRSKRTLQELRPIFLRIAKGLQGSYRSIRVETNKGARHVDIGRIYIPSKLTYRDNDRNTKKVEAAHALFARSQRSSGQSRRTFELLSDEEERYSLTKIPYTDLRLFFSRVVVLGDPGGGKSTLCQYLCHDLAKQAVAAIQLTGDSKPTAQLQKVPFRIILRHYEQARVSEPQLSILEFIVRDLLNHVSGERAELEEAVAYLLSSGAAVLAFDGLDEILATAHRREFVDLVLSFAAQFPLCPVLVTSRLVGYDDASLPDSFDELILEKFDDKEILNYSKKFMRVIAGHSDKDAEARAAQFFRQTTNNASDLRRNPLLLGLMAWIFNMKGDVPSNRPEIYRECAVLMFEKWDPDRDIKANMPNSFDKLQLFSHLASKIFGQPELSGGVEGKWLEKAIYVYLQAIYENRAQAYEAAKAVVHFITGRAWVMSEVGENTFAFTHQTFLEYFFARYVDDTYDTVAELFNYIMPHVLKKEWDVVAHLSLQIKTYRNLRRQNEGLELLTTALAESAGSQAAAISSFAARALEYLTGAEGHVRGLVDKIVEFALRSAVSEEFEPLRDIGQCTLGGAERRQFIESYLVERLAGEYRSENLERMALVAKVLTVRRDHLGHRPELPRELSARVKGALRSYVMERVESSAFHAARAWQWYGVLTRGLAAKHGIITYLNAPLPGIQGIDGLTAMVLTASESYHERFAGVVNRGEVRRALADIGVAGFSSWPFTRRLVEIKVDNGPPLELWRDLLGELSPYPKSCAGAFLAFLLCAELEARTENGGPERKGRKRVSRDDVIRWALGDDKLRQLPFFAQMKSAAEADTLFL